MLAVLGAIATLFVSAGEQPPAEEKLYDVYNDFRQIPIRNADLVKLAEEAVVIAVVRFDPTKIQAAAEGPTTWKAQVLDSLNHRWPWDVRFANFKGKPGNEVVMNGNPKEFLPSEAPEVDVKKGFGFAPSRNTFLVFLKSAGEAGAYQCLAANPGGMQLYDALGAGATDHRKLYVGRVNGRLVVEGGQGYNAARMCGPTNMLDALRNAQTGATLTAKVVGGATVELELKLGGAGFAPSELVLAAPLLWAEIEGPAGDAVLLALQDYVHPEKDMAHVEAKNVVNRTMTAKVELPIGPVPPGADLTWAHANHRKPLAGSLGKGEHAVRFLCHVTENVLVLSNLVTVQGVEGAAGPAQLAALEKDKPPVFVPKTPAVGEKPIDPKPGVLDKKDLQGLIFFDSNRDGSWDVFVMNADGSEMKNLTNTPDADEFEPKSSPDGRRVVYVKGKKGTLKNAGIWGGRWDAGELWLADINGQNAKKITDKGSRPDWSPDGKVVFYSGEVNGKGAFCAQDVETGKVGEPLKKAQKFMRGIAGGMAAPGKLKVAFGGKLWTQTEASLYVADLDANYEFKTFKVVHPNYRGCTPRWSASGELLYFAHHDPQHRGEIILWTIKPDGTEARRFETPTRKSWPGYDPFCESPDGKMFVFLEWGGSGVNVMRFADGASAKLLENKDKVAYGGLWWHRGETIR